MAWRSDTRKQVRIEIDPWFGSRNRYILPLDLVKFLNEHGKILINQISDLENTSLWGQGWLSALALNLSNHWHQVRMDYTRDLNLSHVRLVDREDELVWVFSKRSQYNPKEGYLVTFNRRKPEDLTWWWNPIWKLKSPPKENLLLWSILSNKIPTEENLRKISF